MQSAYDNPATWPDEYRAEVHQRVNEMRADQDEVELGRIVFDRDDPHEVGGCATCDALRVLDGEISEASLTAKS